MKFAILGAGNGGQTMAAYLTSLGHQVALYDIDSEKLKALRDRKTIFLSGVLNIENAPAVIAESIREAVEGADMVMVTTTADAHYDVAVAIAPHLKANQTVVLHPGAVLGALLFRNTLIKCGVRECPIIAEVQDLVFTCRSKVPGEITVSGIKKRLKLSALPASAAQSVVNSLKDVFNQFIPAENLLETGLSFTSSVSHPAPMLLNTGRIESGEAFEYYNEGITDSVSLVMEKIDAERIAIGKAFGLDLISVLESQKQKYGISAENLHSAYQQNTAFRGIMAPKTMSHRFLFEDVPAGMVPLSALGKLTGIPTPAMDAIITLSCIVAGKNYWSVGRSLNQLGLEGKNKEQLVEIVS